MLRIEALVYTLSHKIWVRLLKINQKVETIRWVIIGILLTVVVLNAYVTFSFHYCIWNFVYLFNPGLKIFVGKVSNSYVEL